MRYNTVKSANRILDDRSVIIKRPEFYKNKWSSVFGNTNPIHLELGMGRGSMIVELAKTHPNINYIGLERDENQTASAASNAGINPPKNLKMICADAKDLLNFFGKEIDTIYLTFSEPWPKKEDERKRFTHESYLRMYDRIYKKRKHIIFKTDNKILFASGLESLSNYWYTFKTVSMDLHHDERNIPNVMTEFERQYFKDGRTVYYVDAIYED